MSYVALLKSGLLGFHLDFPKSANTNPNSLSHNEAEGATKENHKTQYGLKAALTSLCSDPARGQRNETHARLLQSLLNSNLLLQKRLKLSISTSSRLRKQKQSFVLLLFYKFLLLPVWQLFKKKLFLV